MLFRSRWGNRKLFHQEFPIPVVDRHKYRNLFPQTDRVKKFRKLLDSTPGARQLLTEKAMSTKNHCEFWEKDAWKFVTKDMPGFFNDAFDQDKWDSTFRNTGVRQRHLQVYDAEERRRRRELGFADVIAWDKWGEPVVKGIDWFFTGQHWEDAWKGTKKGVISLYDFIVDTWHCFCYEAFYWTIEENGGDCAELEQLIHGCEKDNECCEIPSQQPSISFLPSYQPTITPSSLPSVEPSLSQAPSISTRPSITLSEAPTTPPSGQHSTLPTDAPTSPTTAASSEQAEP